jgi:hypothetical protein
VNTRLEREQSALAALESTVESQCKKHDAVFDMNHRDEFYIYFSSTDQIVVCGTEYESALLKATVILDKHS